MRGKRTDHPVYSSVTLSLTLSHQGRGESEEEHYPVSKFVLNTIDCGQRRQEDVTVRA
jgi:hypothetical protein